MIAGQGGGGYTPVVNPQQSKSFVRSSFKKGIHCEHCKMEGHGKENCYKLIGYPAGHPIHTRTKFVSNRGRNNSRAMNVTQSSDDSCDEGKAMASSMEQLQTQVNMLMSMMQKGIRDSPED